MAEKHFQHVVALLADCSMVVSFVNEEEREMVNEPRVKFENRGIRVQRRVRWLSAVVVMLVAAAAAAGDVSGNWTLTISDPFGMDNDVGLTLAQDGEVLSGKVDEASVEGSVEDGRITFHYDVDSGQVGMITLTYTGTVDEDGMRGEVDFGGFAAGAWRAVRQD